jgi:multiple sugar transport system ATP-binding protein
MTEIRFEKVMKRFGETTVINETTLTIHKGEFFTFVGPSGCGKSTILNMIAGLEEVSSGEILFDGKVVNDLSPRDRDVAMVFQSYALYPHMNVYENIAFPLRMKKAKRDFVEKEVKRVASLLGLHDLLMRRPKELSGGQRQRVALGRAIVRRPKVFLMDEPLSNLDARLRIETRTEIKRLHQELEITTVYVTHDQAEAMGLSDRIAVINQGLIEQCGTPPDVYERPASIFVGSFMGSIPMNLVRCPVRGTYPVKVDVSGVVVTLDRGEVAARDEVVLGLRPEDLSVRDTDTDEAVAVSILAVEPAGSYNVVDLEWGGVHLKGTAKTGVHVRAGESAFAVFPADKVILFDAESGKRL